MLDEVKNDVTVEPVTPVSTTAPESVSAGSDVDWVEASTPDKDDVTTPTGKGEPVVTKPVDTAPVKELPATPVSTATPAVVPAVVATAPVTLPAVAPVVTPAPTTPATPPTPAVETPAAASQDMKVLREQELTRLQEFYALGDEDSRLALTQPELVLPKMAAALHLNVLESVVNTIMSRVPDVVRMVQKVEGATQKNEDTFFSAWPQLNKPEFRQTVWNSVAAYRHINPSAPMDEVVKAAGLQALISLRLPIPRELLEMPTEPVGRSTFTPASPAGGAQPQQPGGGTPTNPFAVLSEEFIADDKAWR